MNKFFIERAKHYLDKTGDSDFSQINPSKINLKEEVTAPILTVINKISDLTNDRNNLQIKLDSQGLLKDNIGKQFYKADHLLDKALEEYKKLSNLI